MSDAYIVCAVRTATGRNKGRLSNIHPVDLGAIVVDELIDRTSVPTDAVDDFIFGVVSQIGAQAGNLGRAGPWASLRCYWCKIDDDAGTMSWKGGMGAMVSSPYVKAVALPMP